MPVDRQSSKTKCDRGRPACARCVTQGVDCVYGVSRKAGKPPRRRPATPAPLASPSPGDPETTRIDLTGGRHDSIDIMLGLAEGTMTMDSPFSASDTGLQTWFAFDSFGSPGAAKSIPSGWDACMSEQSGSTLTPLESSTTTVAETVAARPYCTQESKEIMRRLYCANPSSALPDGVPASTLDLDSVLTRNRDVIGRLGLLLKCPCARSPHSAMLYASIVSRVLLWYRQAVWKIDPAGASSLPWLLPTLAAQETPPSISSSAPLEISDVGAAYDNRNVSVLPTPVMVGTFQSDDRSLQTALADCLILSELRGVGGLIDSFISLGTDKSGTQTAGDACPAAAEFSASVADASLFASLGAWLQTEHKRIVTKARPSLSMLGENLTF
ncbi:Fc.00g068040.m01.CDS01 [Cosmosporella sp. VM-42]